MLALAAHLPPEARELRLVAPNRSLAYRPLSAVGEFVTHPPHGISLAALGSATGTSIVHDKVAVVDEERRRLLTRDGEWVDFDCLVLATGARELTIPRAWLPWPAEGDPGMLYGLLAGIGSGNFPRIAIVVPASSGWPLAGYELAAILAVAAGEVGTGSHVSLLTEERRPLAVLGEEAERVIEAELAEAGVELTAGVAVREPDPPTTEGEDWYAMLIRRLRAPEVPPPAPIGVAVGERSAEFDLLISLPRNHGPGIAGVAADARGYVVVEDGCRVRGSERVWAAGDCTSLPLKHSTLAVAQADAAADELVGALGAAVPPPKFEPALAGVLVAGAARRWWAENTSLPEGLEPATHCLWWPPGKVLGGRLAHYAAGLEPGARPLLVGHPHGTAVEVRPRPSSSAGDGGAHRIASDERALDEDAYDRRIYALHRVEREAAELLEELEAEGARDRSRSTEMLSRLNEAGYVIKDHPSEEAEPGR